jgi:ferredoxin-NADP reductase
VRTNVIAERHSPGGVSEHQVFIADRRQESDAAFSLWLARAATGASLPAWAPGAHIDVMLPSGMIRQFSLCGDPDDRGAWQICVQREQNSRGGTVWLAEHANVGTTLTVRGPRNNFPLVDAAGYRFVAGGIGITPILSMIREVDHDGLPWRLVYGGRHRGSMAFADVLADYGQQVNLVPQDELGLIDLQTFLAGPLPGEVVYCCGPEPLLKVVELLCEQWPPRSLHIERFSADPRALAAEPADEASFQVVCAQSGVTLAVPPGRSILSVAEENGIDVVFSCTEGVCGTCETTVLGGVPEHHDSLLTDEEREASETMMICVSRCRQGPLVLDL